MMMRTVCALLMTLTLATVVSATVKESASTFAGQSSTPPPKDTAESAQQKLFGDSGRW